MANEFHYCVSLSIIHPTVDPKLITDKIACLRPRIETLAGSQRRGRDGKPLVPSRKALLSHWLADLHKAERLYSADIDLSEFILDKLNELDAYQGLFSELRKEGEVVLRIGWFSDTNHSAGVLGAKALKKCGDLAIDIELNYYGPSTATQ